MTSAVGSGAERPPVAVPDDGAATRVHFAESDVLTAVECRTALSISKSHWQRVAPSLPVSYALGKQSPRYVWGEVLKFLKRTGAAAA